MTDAGHGNQDSPRPEHEGSSATPLRDELQASLRRTYTVEREIGGSGMSRVFVADEPALGRKVVIKVLTPELGPEISAERFAREIRLAASLQQANIVPLLAAGTAGGLPYYTMPYVEGRSLRDRLLRDGPLPVQEALGILRDVARALAYAHARGVVHRDIKPGNVLLSGGTAVVTDFGIAKALGAARNAAGASAPIDLTRSGVAIGTPAYMAPEQATGDPAVDHRADLYAFGCVAYEILSGTPPFRGKGAHELIVAHLSAAAPPLTDARPDVPAAVADLIARCLEKDPARRPQSGEEILAAIETSTSQPTERVRPRSRPGSRALATLAVAAIVIAATMTLLRYQNRAAPEPLTLGALPFLNLAHDTALDYLSDGLSDEMLTSLGRLPGVRISGRQSAYRYKGRTDVDVPGVARQLGVRFLITGTLREGDGRLTASAQLNDSTTRGELWSATFVRPRNDFASLPNEIAKALADTLRARFPGQVSAPRPSATIATTNPRALDAYLVGQEQLKRRAIEESVASFQRAIQLDPTFARAHAALAMGLTYYPYYLGTPPTRLRDSIIAEARRALSSDPSLADAHAALGAEYGNSFALDSVDLEFQRAVALEPDNFNAHFSWGRLLVAHCKAREGLRELSKANTIERASGLVAAWRALAFVLDGQRDSVRYEIDRALQLEPSQFGVLSVAEVVYHELGSTNELRRVLAEPEPPRVMTIRPYLLARLGDTAAASRIVRRVEALTPRPWYVEVAHAYLALGTADTAAALDALDASARSSGPMWAMPLPPCFSPFDPIRRSPRFAALVRKANLDVNRLTTGVRREP